VSTPAGQAAEVARLLRERRLSLWEEYKAIANGAALEHRELDGEERARSAALQDEMSGIDSRLKAGSGTGSFFDIDNPLLGQVPARLDTGTMGPAGEAPRGVLTWRTASTTMTVVASAADMRTWADIISELADFLAAWMPAETAEDVIRLAGDGKGSPGVS
jgi:hypothetical protein